MSAAEQRGLKRAGSPLVSERTMPARHAEQDVERGDVPLLSPAPPTSVANAHHLARITAVRPAIDSLLAAVQHGANLFLPLKNALTGVLEVLDLSEVSLLVYFRF